ncbi:hypothetical protein [Celeribacter sp. PS-C1]|uniref:hypothetical protein n=1 Tax=Celeribacter sp. PS-C1 TaxID=2820813 RepID=UPI001CA4FE57|nr:hypothetical protein [Celeribacter sp. PS-C1]MBW6418248.1 hypothetical protein [Celeribacter sp. PS-C1]
MTTRRTAFLCFLFAVSITGVSGVQAQSLIGDVLCGTKEDIHTKLTRQFGAVKTGAGLRGPEAVMEIWTNPKSGDWTLVQTYVEGNSCIVAMGEYWEDLVPTDTPETAG